MAMFARVSSYRTDDAGKLLDGFENVTGPLEQMDGFSRAYFLIGREGGKAMSITVWETEAAMSAGVEKANELRRQATEGGGGSIESVEEYDVALTVRAPAVH
jgi:heme-degrading monooxygenase HmoA